jgi:hypothetical protein
VARIYSTHGTILYQSEGVSTVREACEAANALGLSLECAQLQKADLSWADLPGARLRCGRLSCADLTGADLTGAELRAERMPVTGYTLPRARIHIEREVEEGEGL